MEIRKQLKAIRAMAGISQKDLAARANVTQKQISLIEGGKDCCISTIRRLLNELGYDIVAVPIEQKEGGNSGE
jgi:predicted transcriptional regulator